MKCLCGCGQEVLKRRTFVKGHTSKNRGYYEKYLLAQEQIKGNKRNDEDEKFTEVICTCCTTRTTRNKSMICAICEIDKNLNKQ